MLFRSTISLAAGMSKNGLIPFVHTIAPFMVERALEQLKIDFGYQELGGNIVSIGNSYDYASLGATHHCPADIQVLQSIPNINIFTPGTSNELNHLITANYNNGKLNYYRLSEFENSQSNISENKKATVIKKGSLATIIVVGNMLDNVVNACKNIDVTILYYNTVTPFDSKTLIENFNKQIIVCQPFYSGSIDTLITDSLDSKFYNIFNIGIPKQFIHNYGSKEEHDFHLKLDETGINTSIKQKLNI